MNDHLRLQQHHDLLFVARVLVPERGDSERIAELLGDDVSLLNAMLEDSRLFEQVMGDEDIFVSVSPQLFFKVLLVRARRDLEQAAYTVERRNLQNVVLFDADQVVELLAQPDVRDYLAQMLASFTRIESVNVPFKVRPGVWRRLRVNDLDIDSLIRYAQLIEEEHRFRAYQRIADACLFLTGIFSEHIEASRYYPSSGQTRLRLKSALIHSLEDHESYGQAFYRLAAQHDAAASYGLAEVLHTVSEHFVLAEKALSFIAERYLSIRKHKLFEI